MKEIQLQYVENIITRKKSGVQQHLTFVMSVENLGYQKSIDVLWAGEDGVWHTLPAHFHCALGSNRECWRAHAQVRLSEAKSLPGNIAFSLRYRTESGEYWDNNNGWNHTSQADSGVRLSAHNPIQVIGFNNTLSEHRKYTSITVAADQTLALDKVTVHWTTDNWLHRYQTACHFKPSYWDKALRSNARNPNQYGVQLWKGWIKTGDVFRLQFSVAGEAGNRIVWDSNQGLNYSAARKPVKILILNLHCYQEDDQDSKFSCIAAAIDQLGVDIVCFQEVAEFWNDGHGDWPSNSANIINSRLKKAYHLATDWSHLGFDKFREGIAILSRYPLVHQESRYVSDSHDPYNIHARKVVMAQVKVPAIGLLNVYSAHLSWWEDGFQPQFERLRDWARDQHGDNVVATLLCGDFNVAAGSQGYRHIVEGHEYEDQFLAVSAHDTFTKIFRVDDPYWRNYLGDDYRIDYIFMDKNGGLTATAGRALFTGDDTYGRVSDHCGYLIDFEPRYDTTRLT